MASKCIARSALGLLESAYSTCLWREFAVQEIRATKEVPIGLEYKGVSVDHAYRADFLVEDRVLVEVKSVARLETIHDAQLLTYMKLEGVRVGLLMNFNAPTLRQGIRRLLRPAR